LAANGTAGAVWGAGGGSGGGIYVTCSRFAGTSGALQANGGNGAGTTGPGGGGGRIAVWRTLDTSAGVTATVTPGGGYATADVGTVVWGTVLPRGTVIVVR
jgi:hypothetical protein